MSYSSTTWAHPRMSSTARVSNDFISSSLKVGVNPWASHRAVMSALKLAYSGRSGKHDRQAT